MNNELPELVGTLARLPAYERKAIEEYGKACANVAVKQYKESLVVELPERNNNEYRPEFSIGWNSCLNRFIKYLQSAGINYRERE